MGGSPPGDEYICKGKEVGLYVLDLGDSLGMPGWRGGLLEVAGRWHGRGRVGCCAWPLPVTPPVMYGGSGAVLWKGTGGGKISCRRRTPTGEA